MADPTRRRMVEVLKHGPARAGDLANGVGLPPTTTTRHLKTLRDARIVEVVPVPEDGRGRVYSLRVEPMLGLQAWIDQVSAYWAEQLAAFKLHAHRRAGR